eukprot:m.24490 g.24490  ORF g.24490 m.24490 type:complete len:448 (+) comp7612_c0_seq1:272-1615(+)
MDFKQQHDNSFKTTVVMSIAVAICYIGVYFIKYPMFVLSGDHYEKPLYLGISLSSWFGLATTSGYGISKVPAYFFVSEMNRSRRFILILSIILLYFILTVGFFAVSPGYIQISGVFLGGLFGSWIYTVLFTYLEGRRTTEVLAGVLNAAIVFGGSLARFVASLLLKHLPEHLHNWMPLFAAGMLLPASLICLAILNSQPAPSAQDEKQREVRKSMNTRERTKFMRKYAFGMFANILVFAILTTFRSFRDFFAVNIYSELLGHTPSASLYLLADWPAGFFSCGLITLVSLVKDNRVALNLLLYLSFSGNVMLCAVSFLFKLKILTNPTAFIVLIGVGLYLAYMPLGSILYDRLLAVSGTKGTTVFLIFVSDACGYLGTIGLLLYKNLDPDSQKANWEDFFVWACLSVSIISGALILISIPYFAYVIPRAKPGYALLAPSDESIVNGGE